MRKIVSLVLAAVFFLGNTAFATTTEFTAAVTFRGGIVTFDATLSTGSSITWNDASVDLGSATTQWVNATTVINMEKTITKNTGYVYIYQNNKDAAGPGDAKYVATTPRTNKGNKKVYNGLVKGNSNGGENGYMPMTFKISTYTLTSPDLDPRDPNDSSKTKYGVRYLTDQNDDGFGKNGYTMVANSSGYIEDVDASENPNVIENSATVSTGYMYIGAGFTNVVGGDSYGSNHIIFETVGE